MCYGRQGFDGAGNNGVAADEKEGEEEITGTGNEVWERRCYGGGRRTLAAEMRDASHEDESMFLGMTDAIVTKPTHAPLKWELAMKYRSSGATVVDTGHWRSKSGMPVMHDDESTFLVMTDALVTKPTHLP
ncbi:unnamed protein product [Ilex paraguariensis]|uniref:Uncharacterized protein n=1 Tax=Ilex paraguariensis TaxID=185542 RepID=A0ABC8TPL3_9AQUA